MHPSTIRGIHACWKNISGICYCLQRFSAIICQYGTWSLNSASLSFSWLRALLHVILKVMRWSSSACQGFMWLGLLNFWLGFGFCASRVGRSLFADGEDSIICCCWQQQRPWIWKCWSHGAWTEFAPCTGRSSWWLCGGSYGKRLLLFARCWARSFDGWWTHWTTSSSTDFSFSSCDSVSIYALRNGFPHHPHEIHRPACTAMMRFVDEAASWGSMHIRIELLGFLLHTC